MKKVVDFYFLYDIIDLRSVIMIIRFLIFLRLTKNILSGE